MRISALFLIIVLVAGYLWWLKGYRPDVSLTVKATERMPSEIERWLQAGLLSKDQADAIVVFEKRQASSRKIPTFAEALGYIGAVLALAGGGVAIGQVWDDLSEVAHVSILAAATLFALGAGWLIRSQAEPAIQRMMSVLWALSVAGSVATMSLLFVDVVDLSEDARGLAIGGISAAYAALLWGSHRRVLQLVALFGTGLAAAIGVIVILPGEPAGWVLALATWAYGGVWLLLGWNEIVMPAWAAVPLGAVVGSFAPSIAAEEHGWLLAVGLASAALLMALGMSDHNVPLLAIGSVASFAYLTASVVRYFGDTLGVPLALSLVGVLVLALAVTIGRTGTFGGGRWHHPFSHPAG